jgi:hypothetical protein
MKDKTKVTLHRGGYKKAPYFECTPDQWKEYTKGMSERGVRSLANMLAHHMLLLERIEEGWLLTRCDYIKAVLAGTRKSAYAFCSNDGDVDYSFQGTVI